MATRTCLKCGAPLAADTRHEFCPKCLFLQASQGVLGRKEGERRPEAEIWSPLAEDAGVAEEDGTQRPQSDSKYDAKARGGGNEFGDYELLEPVGHGGMGVVYRARQKSLDRIVAIKTMAFGPGANPELVKRFRAEAVAAAALQHPNIVAIHEVGVQEGRHFFVMDYVEGQSLAQLAANRPLSARRAAGYLKTIAEAVDYAHERGILHRDLKPSNVLIDGQDQPRIVDFGLARRLEGASELTVTGQVLGSPHYLPPEQATARRGHVTRRTDVYGLGATLYHLLTGRPPFQAETLPQTLDLVLQTEPVSPRLLNPSVPRDLETICLKCLEKEPGKRYATAEELAEELGRFLEGQPILARPVGRVGKTWRWCRRNPPAAVAVGAVALSLLLGFAGISLALRGERIQRQRAEAGELSARQNAYVLAMNGAQNALDADNQARALELLNLHRPARESETDLRGFEWRYLWQECQTEAEAVVGRMQSRIRCLEVSPDGRWLVAGSELGAITLWNLVTGKQIHLVSEAGVKGGIKGFAAFSPDSSILAFTDQTLSSGMGKISIWETQSRRFQQPVTNAWYTGTMNFSIDGRLFGYGIVGPQFERAAVILDFAARKQIGRVVARTPITDDMHGIDWVLTPDSRSAIFSENDPAPGLVLWHFLGEGRTNHFLAHREAIMAMAISPDGLSLATAAGYSEKAIKLWQIPSFRPLGDLAGHQAWVAGLKFSPDGKTLASAGIDKTIRLWDVAKRTLRRVFQRLPLPVYRVCFSSDGRKLFSGDGAGDIYRWSVDAPAVNAGCRVKMEGLSFVTLAPNSRQFAGIRDGTVCLGTTEGAAQPQVLTDWGTNNLVVLFSSDGESLLAGTQEGGVRIWSLDNGREAERRLPIHGAPVIWLGQSRDGRTLIVGQWNREVREGRKCRLGVWNLATREEVKSWTFSAAVPCMAVSPDGRWVATGHLEGPVQICRLTDRSGPRTLNFSGRIRSVAFSPDSKLLAACSGEGMVKVWRLPHLRELPEFRAHTGETYALAFSPDSRRLATAGDGEEALKLWDVATWKELITLERPRQSLWQIAFSDDSRQIIARDIGGDLLIWRVPTFGEIDAREKTRKSK